MKRRRRRRRDMEVAIENLHSGSEVDMTLASSRTLDYLRSFLFEEVVFLPLIFA